MKITAIVKTDKEVGPMRDHLETQFPTDTIVVKVGGEHHIETNSQSWVFNEQAVREFWQFKENVTK